MGYLSLYDESDLTHLNVSITTCIIDIIHGLPKTPQTLNLLKSFFWVAMGLIQISDVHIFAAGASLVKSIIEILDTHREFKDLGFAETLKSARSVFLKLAMDLDDMTGIWFSADFSFAFTANVLKGLKSERTRELTVSLLKLALDVSGRNPPVGIAIGGCEYVANHCLGFIVPLLPIVPAEDLKQLFIMGGVDEKNLDFDDWLVSRNNFGRNRYQAPITGGLFDTEETNKFRDILDKMTPLDDENQSILMLTLMVGVLEISESESESVFIYGFLAEATLRAPGLIFILYESLLPRMNEIVTGQTSPRLISSVHSIFQTMMACMPISPPSAPYLTPLGIPMRKINVATTYGGGANDQITNLNGMLNNINSVMGGFGHINGKDALILQLAGINAGAGVPNGTIASFSRNAGAAAGAGGGRSTSPSLAALDDDDFQFQEDSSFVDVHMLGIGAYPLSANQQLLSHLQTLGFVGVASANSFNGAGLVQQKQIATMVVQLIRVALEQKQKHASRNPFKEDSTNRFSFRAITQSHTMSSSSSTTAPATAATPITVTNDKAASTSSLSSSVETSTSAPSTPARRRVAKCDFGCGAPAVKTIGTCRYCSAQYCAKHRLPEAHACQNLDSCQGAAKDRLEKRLIGEKTVAAKVAMA
ncbi:Ras GTPase activating protein ira2 [Physocladia obscura]|uniref:Ras GTPase activating protein ira2 n=1 Tax=Physocladia obscura TaxID=109957 RepID=A0AAD5T9D4_9FUNG|nr:Ras GTPase activating protein ira2 [Physocladia obscura]